MKSRPDSIRMVNQDRHAISSVERRYSSNALPIPPPTNRVIANNHWETFV